MNELFQYFHKNILSVQTLWQQKYPDEGVDSNFEYMLGNADFNFMLGLIYFMNNSKPGIKFEKAKAKGYPKACFYNAIAYAKKFNVDVAWGFVVDKNEIEKYKQSINSKPSSTQRLDCLIHCFNVDNGKVIDSTLSHSSSEIYFYKIVPTEIWTKWAYIENDSKDFNASEFGDYVYEQIDNNKNEAANWFKRTYSQNNSLVEKILKESMSYLK